MRYWEYGRVTEKGGVPVTHLRKMMLEELERRNYSASTTHCYIRTVEDFALFFQRPPDQLGLEEIRNYQAHLFRDRKLAGNTVSQRLAALRFFYLKTLRKSWNLSLMPYPKKARRLPSVLSQQEVAGLIEAADSVFHRMILMTLYATGVRRAELIRLQLSDINSRRMVVHVRGGKGRKDRDVMLSRQLLVSLRTYLRGLHRRPKQWLFPGGAWHTGADPISLSVPWNACHEAAQRAGIDKPVHPHTLRHCFATHLLEAGADLRTIQILLGHRDLEETALYLHLSARHLNAVASPLDSLELASSKKEDPGAK